MSDEWGPWIEHDGSGVPVEHGALCEVIEWGRKNSGVFGFGEPAMTWVGIDWQYGACKHYGASWDWRNWPETNCNVIMYRRPQSGRLAFIENIAKGIREPVDA